MSNPNSNLLQELQHLASKQKALYPLKQKITKSPNKDIEVRSSNETAHTNNGGYVRDHTSENDPKETLEVQNDIIAGQKKMADSSAKARVRPSKRKEPNPLLQRMKQELLKQQQEVDEREEARQIHRDDVRLKQAVQEQQQCKQFASMLPPERDNENNAQPGRFTAGYLLISFIL